MGMMIRRNRAAAIKAAALSPKVEEPEKVEAPEEVEEPEKVEAPEGE